RPSNRGNDTVKPNDWSLNHPPFCAVHTLPGALPAAHDTVLKIPRPGGKMSPFTGYAPYPLLKLNVTVGNSAARATDTPSSRARALRLADASAGRFSGPTVVSTVASTSRMTTESIEVVSASGREAGTLASR